MKPKMKSCPTITLRKCRDEQEIRRASELAIIFIRNYETRTGYDCLFASKRTGDPQYYVKCTATGNVTVWRC